MAEGNRKEVTKIRLMEIFEKYDNHTLEGIQTKQGILPGYKEIGVHMIFDIN